jgi:hypothetical protein
MNYSDGTPSPRRTPLEPLPPGAMSIDFDRFVGMIGEWLSKHEPDDDMTTGFDI